MFISLIYGKASQESSGKLRFILAINKLCDITAKLKLGRRICTFRYLCHTHVMLRNYNHIFLLDTKKVLPSFFLDRPLLAFRPALTACWRNPQDLQGTNYSRCVAFHRLTFHKTFSVPVLRYTIVKAKYKEHHF